MPGGKKGGEGTEVLTIGHSARSLEEFIALLHEHGIKRVVDVRRYPRSRHNPQFNSDALRSALRAAGVGYTHIEALGGRRRPDPDSLNSGWRNLSFRGYADYMRTEEFAAGLDSLMELAAAGRVAIMCSEAVPWRCHRMLIADALTVRGIGVAHIIDAGRARPHELTPFAQVSGVEITYSPAK